MGTPPAFLAAVFWLRLSSAVVDFLRYACPAGSTNATASVCIPGQLSGPNSAQCRLCPAGYFCNSSGLSQPTGPCLGRQSPALCARVRWPWIFF